ncbi:MAG: protoporphyrinogen oxidase, partial [Rhodospirillaceae bacterium]|nr:protoporphyrinogen oxidase [Rhodospirillaceae bacterium]
MVDVAIIGGGISGLATAYDLMARGLDVVVLERQVRAGGNAISERVGDFLMEHGPSTINAQSIAAHDISRRLGLAGDQRDLGAGVKSRYLVGKGKLQGIPVHPLGFVFSNYLGLKGRLRLMAEFMVPRYKGNKEETIAEFAARRFGVEFAEKVIDPLVAGIYAGRAADLSVEAGFPKLYGLEQSYGSIARGLVQHHRQGAKGMPSSRLFSYKNGVGSLPKALAQSLGARVKTGVTVRNIKKSSDGFSIDTGEHGELSARAIVIATQPHVAAELLESVDAPSSIAASEIQAPPLAVVYLGFERKNVEHPLDGLGFLAPESENISMSGSQFCSTMFPGRAPKDCVAIAGYLGGARAPDLARLPAKDLIEIAQAEFGDLIGAKGEPLVARVRHWPRGLPQYRLGHNGR